MVYIGVRKLPCATTNNADVYVTSLPTGRLFYYFGYLWLAPFRRTLNLGRAAAACGGNTLNEIIRAPNVSVFV